MTDHPLEPAQVQSAPARPCRNVLHDAFSGRPLTHDLPGSVGLAACRAMGMLRLAANGDGLLEFSAFAATRAGRARFRSGQPGRRRWRRRRHRRCRCGRWGRRRSRGRCRERGRGCIEIRVVPGRRSPGRRGAARRPGRRLGQDQAGAAEPEPDGERQSDHCSRFRQLDHGHHGLHPGGAAIRTLRPILYAANPCLMPCRWKKMAIPLWLRAIRCG